MDKTLGSEQSFGVFKPVGHLVISFPGPAQADAATQALAALGIGGESVRRLSDREMVAQATHDIAQAGALASVGQEMNLVKAQLALAERGYHWLVVKVGGDATLAQRIAEVARAHGAERAQSYGHFVIEELINRPGDEKQVAESPDRGLDAQVPSGREADRAQARPAPDEATKG